MRGRVPGVRAPDYSQRRFRAESDLLGLDKYICTNIITLGRLKPCLAWGGSEADLLDCVGRHSLAGGVVDGQRG